MHKSSKPVSLQIKVEFSFLQLILHNLYLQLNQNSYILWRSERWCFIQSLMMDRWLTLLRDHTITLYRTNIKHNSCSNISVNPQLHLDFCLFVLFCFVFFFAFISQASYIGNITSLKWDISVWIIRRTLTLFEICLYLSWTLRTQSLAIFSECRRQIKLSSETAPKLHLRVSIFMLFTKH